MDIHHAAIIRQSPERVYQALTQRHDLEIWMDAPALARPEVNATIEIQYDQGKRKLKMEVIRLDANKIVQWRVIQPVWESKTAQQVITWQLIPTENGTLLDFRMDGWTQDDDVYASVSYKWASFMMRLKIHLGDTREIVSLLPNPGNYHGISQ